jgi:hypothetical protein
VVTEHAWPPIFWPKEWSNEDFRILACNFETAFLNVVGEQDFDANYADQNQPHQDLQVSEMFAKPEYQYP